MRITCDPAKREWTLQERSLDMFRAKEVFAGPHLTRTDDRRDYGEQRLLPPAGSILDLSYSLGRRAAPQGALSA